MEIKIDNKTIGLNANKYKKTSLDSSFSFPNILNEVKLKSENTVDSENKEISELEGDITIGNLLIDALPEEDKTQVLDAIEKLNNIFDIDMLGSPDKFFKKDSTINITRILGQYGNNVTSSELADLGESINILMKNGLISDEDYFSTLRWIATKQEAFRVQMKSEENKASLSDLMWKPKKL